MNKEIKTLYKHYKNTPKRLKIVCDWDEVIQACESYALWKVYGLDFSEVFEKFGSVRDCPISYSLYGSKLNITEELKEEERKPWNPNSVELRMVKKQQQIKNSPNFYQEAPFLTIAEDLLKLIREDKVEKLIFLSAYDEGKFPDGDTRKLNIFLATFGKLCASLKTLNSRIELIPFDSETQGQTKADWIKQNASDYDIVIDDNPNICRSLVESSEPEIEVNEKKITRLLKEKNCAECNKEVKREELAGFHTESYVAVAKEPICKGCWNKSEYIQDKQHEYYWSLEEMPWAKTIIAPYYLAVEKQHDERVLLVKNEVSGLKKEDF